MTLKEQLQSGEYEVDPQKVADALIKDPLFRLLMAAQRLTGSRPATGSGGS
ncbi:MAG: flagellar biosynthesis anti-sigma factor FlgM [Solirubrobacteraceae bacterium]